MMQRRICILALSLGLVTLLIAGRLIQLQVVEHDRWFFAARAMQERIVEILPRRGTIYDRNGFPLAFDVKALAIAVDSFNMTNPETIVTILSEELGRTREELRSLIYRQSYFTWIDRSVNLARAKAIERRAREARAHGLIFIDTWKRRYPEGALASNLIGFVGMDRHGLAGLEKTFDDVLSGTPTTVRILRGADGRTYHSETLHEGTPGEDLTLTIDARLQFICEEAITSGVARFKANAGFFILLDPRNGDILAMAQDQRFDLNRFWESTEDERRNLAISFLFEPGSTFKAISGLAALDHGVISPTSMLDGNTGIRVAGHTLHNAEFRSHGTVTFRRTISHSINTAMVRVAQRLGEEDLHHALISLGFGKETGIELPGEERGILRDLDEWSGLSLAMLSFGQEIAVTGIQLALGMAVIANGGLLPVPRIVQSIGERADDPAMPRRVTSPESAAAMSDMLRTVIESGTGTWADLPGFYIAGKTGTAQKAFPGRGYVAGKYTSLFAGFFPADEPAFLALVVLDEVMTTPVWGGVTSGSIFREAAARLVRFERIPPVAKR